MLLTDLPHITPLTRANVARNTAHTGGRARVADFKWGRDVAPLEMTTPDVVVAAGEALLLILC